MLPPKMTSHRKLYKTGAVKVPLMNSLIVRPFEILAMNMPENEEKNRCVLIVGHCQGDPFKVPLNTLYRAIFN